MLPHAIASCPLSSGRAALDVHSARAGQAFTTVHEKLWTLTVTSSRDGGKQGMGIKLK